jgi:hypothetical protein
MYSLREENFISPRYFPRSLRLWYLTFFPISPQQKWCFGLWPGLVFELPKSLAVTIKKKCLWSTIKITTIVLLYTTLLIICYIAIFTRVGTYGQRGSKFSSSSSWGHRHCLKYCIIVQFHHAFSSLARQHCPAALPSSLARQPCPAALPGSLVPAALLGSLAWQPCPAVRPISTGFDARARSLRIHRTVLQLQVTKLHGRAAVLIGLNLFLVRFHHAFI